MTHAGVRALALVALVGACGEDPPVDAVDADPMGADAGGADAGTGGLLFEFESRPEIPGDSGGRWNATVASVELSMTNVRAIGDAVPVGDARTTRAAFALEWGDGKGVYELMFPSAPPGLYSHLLAGVTSYAIEGSVEVEGERFTFEIEDTPPALSISVELSQVIVVAGELTTVNIEVDIGRLIDELDWDEVELVGGTLRLDVGSSEIDDVREQIGGAFSQND